MSNKCRLALTRYRFKHWRMRIQAFIIALMLINTWYHAATANTIQGRSIFVFVGMIVPIAAYFGVRQFDKLHQPAMDRITREHNNDH